jgi:DNA primase
VFIDLLKQELGESKPAGNQTRFNCPFCGEVKMKFYVNTENGLWDCKKCSMTGNPVKFVMTFYEIGFPDAADVLALYDYDVDNQNQGNYNPDYGDDLTEEEKLLLFIEREGQPFEQDEMEEKLNPPKLPTNTKLLMKNFYNPEAVKYFIYLNSRGVVLDQIKLHDMAYVEEGKCTLDSGKQITLRNHIVFFTKDDNGKRIYWNTRSVDADPFIKSLNAPSAEGEYSKSTTVFNLNNITENSSRIVIHEGVFDALTVKDSVATFGKKLTKKQVDLIADKAKKLNLPIYIFLDVDDAKNEMKQLRVYLRDRDVESPIYYVFNRTGKDANKLGTLLAEDMIKHHSIKADSSGDLMLDLYF